MKMGNAESSSSTPITDLPESCIAHILSLTTPLDVCRSSAVASSVRLAASSNYVWERMLPRDVHHLLSRSASPVHFFSMKELFSRLCSAPLLIDSERKSFSLDRSNGKKCFMISARELSICWGNDERYWRWINLPESRFPEVAELLQVCWLDIRGQISTADLSPSTRYAAYFVLKHTNGSFGFNFVPAKLSIRANDSPHVLCEHEALLHAGNARTRRRGYPRRATESPPGSALRPRMGDGEWMEVEVGEFCTDEEGGELEFVLREISGHWKGGCCLRESK